MINVQVRRGPNRAIEEVFIEGHAGYADPGEDLVCAAVSAITFGIANSIEQLLQIETVEAIGESGFLHFKLPPISEPKVFEQVQLLISSMLISLNTIVDSYADYIKVEDID